MKWSEFGHERNTCGAIDGLKIKGCSTQSRRKDFGFYLCFSVIDKDSEEEKDYDLGIRRKNGGMMLKEVVEFIPYRYCPWQKEWKIVNLQENATEADVEKILPKGYSNQWTFHRLIEACYWFSTGAYAETNHQAGDYR
jgi:hypothetical protein